VGLIDDQHKILFEKADKLFEAGRNHQAREYLDDLLKFLENYTKQHFFDEDNYMLSIHYPGLSVQKQAHAEFIRQLNKLRSDYNASGGNVLVVINANQLMLNWLTQHISVMDRQIGQFAITMVK
jgi:hemerythrin